ncbi:hypothetical protein F9802_04000 [Bacillus aerolatus]|uniref:Abortive phage infection protein n=1 Tax=Bacillus aerolatus TaxID=2653354 RepID=A0A6I1FSY7_9BACI|nr:hypothetical protein [Bacillus aerolatus]KAB7707885.1 hypothetical protein F9802_04000 [Bacillus aerolatus]
MTLSEAESLLNQLKTGEIDTCYVSKEHFLVFQNVLVNREDFKHFRGVAQRGGSVLYNYMKEPRS